MDLVSNFIGSVSPSMFGNSNQNTTPSIDLDDKTFSDMLEERLNNKIEKNTPDIKNNFGFGLASGINISDFDGSYPQFNINTENKSDTVKPVNEFENTADFNNKHDMSTSEVVTFFSSLFDSKPTLTDTSRSGLFDFERKVAAGSYDKYSKSIITDLHDFVTDTIKMKS